MRTTSLVVLAVLACIVPALSSTCDGTPNTLPVWNDKLTFVSKVANGARWTAGFANDTQPLTVLHLYGSPYEWGVAQGQLMGNEIRAMLKPVLDWIYAQISGAVSDYPPWLQAIILADGPGAFLDMTYAMTLPYQDPWFTQELQGLADAANVSFTLLARLAMFPEASEMGCTIVGANAAAVAPALNGNLIQLRALDWGDDAPIANWPVLMVYHPTGNASTGHDFASLAWVGFVGGVTGASKFLFQSEKFWDTANSSNPRDGIPATFLIRNMLQFDESVEASVNRVQQASRTCAFNVGLGSVSTNEFQLVQVSHDTVNVYDSGNFPGWPGHPQVPGLVYLDKHSQPSDWRCMQDLMNSTYGSMTAPMLFQQVAALAQTGDQHVVSFDATNDVMYVAVAQAPTASSPLVPAYSRGYMRFTLSDLWNEPAPTL